MALFRRKKPDGPEGRPVQTVDEPENGAGSGRKSPRKRTGRGLYPFLTKAFPTISALFSVRKISAGGTEAHRRPAEQDGPEGRPAVPRHIAVIMDGNGRWATNRGLPRTAGHSAGSETFRRVSRYCRDIGVEYFTVYAFSTENWKRSHEEVEAILKLLDKYLREAIDTMEQERMKLVLLGDLSRLSPQLRALADRALEVGKNVQGMQVNVCFNYGGRDEILRAARRYAEDYAAGKAPADLDEAGFAAYLDSAGIPDPDIIIRSGGEQRTSNFLLWQSAYAEYWFTDTLWPDFGPAEIDAAIAAFGRRDRRFGGVKDAGKG